LGDDRLGRAARDPGNRVELGQRSGLRGGEALDVALAGGDGLVEELDGAEKAFQPAAGRRGDAPRQRLPQGRALAAPPPLGRLRLLIPTKPITESERRRSPDSLRKRVHG